MSAAEAFLEVVSEARVFDRGLKGEEVTGEAGAVEDELLNAGCEGERLDASEPADCDLDVIGTIRFWMFGLIASVSLGLGTSPSGISSALGIAIPRAAAMS